MNKLTFTTGLILLFFNLGTIFAQENWEPQTKITGYISTEFNGFSDLEGYNNNYGVSLAEAGILTSYQPTNKLSFKAVFVYRPNFDFNQMLNEANIQYSVSKGINFKVGRFLTPLSPMNTYYYAPVNTSATLPVLISNHEFFPLNMDALSINGSVGEDFALVYDAFAGGYINSVWMRTGPVGFFGDEMFYFQSLTNSAITVNSFPADTYNVGFGGNLTFKYRDYVDLGFSAFKRKDEEGYVNFNVNDAINPFQFPVGSYDFDSKIKRFSYGANIKLKYKNTKLIGEIWEGDLNVSAATPIGRLSEDIDLKGSFFELSHSIHKFTPYVRYEDQTTFNIEYQRYTAGVMFKPMFETAFKLEYMHYDVDVDNVGGLVASFIYSF